MAFEGNCNQNLQPTGVQNVCVEWSSIAGFWRAKPGFEFATEADAQDYANWETAIQNEDVYPFPLIFSQEVEDEDVVNEEGSLGIVPIRKGKKSWKFMIATNPYQDACLQSQDNAPGGIFYISTQGAVRGVTNGVKLLPIPYQLFQVQKPVENNGTDAGNKTQIKVVVSDVDAYIKDVAIIEPNDIDWDPKAVTGLQSVTLSPVSASATTIVVDAFITKTSVKVQGLDNAPSGDFLVQTAAGVEIVPSLITEVDGRYTLTVTGLVTGDTITLVDPSSMVTKGYKSYGAVSLTVV